MVCWPDAVQDRLPASSPGTRPRCPDIRSDLAKDAELLLVFRHRERVPLEYSIEWLTCAFASGLDVMLVSLPVGFRNSATRPDLGFYAARSYSLMRPPRTGRRLIRSWERSAAG